MTVAVVDRLVHHATIFEMNVESYRRRAALEREAEAAADPRDNHSECLIAAPATLNTVSPPCATATQRQSCRCRGAGFPS
jgi:hypothetical protein